MAATGITANDIRHFLRANQQHDDDYGLRIPDGRARVAPQQGRPVCFEGLMGIEKSDERFHKHTLVRHLRKLLDGAVAAQLDALFSRGATDVAHIVDAVMASQEYAALVTLACDQTRRAVHQAKNKDPPNPATPTRSIQNKNYINSFSTHSNATNDSSLGSLNSSSFNAPPLEEVKLILSNLQNKNPTETRFAAAQTGELFLILIQHLISYFENGSAPKLRTGLSPTSDPRTDLLLRKFRLVLQFQLELPSCWLRFPDQMFCNCLNAAYRLLRKPQFSIGALHVMSVLDVQAGWFEKWTLSCVGRAQSVASIMKADLARDLVSSFVSYLAFVPLGGECFPTSANGGSDEVVVMDVEMSEEVEKDEDGGSDGGMIAWWDLEYTHFVQVMVMLGKLVRGKAGRMSCFPVVVDISGMKWKEKEMLGVLGELSDKLTFTVEMFIRILVLLMCKCPRIGPSHVNFDQPTTDLTLDSECCKLIYTNKVISELIKPVQKLNETPTKPHTPNLNELVLINIARLFSNMASSSTARNLILYSDSTPPHHSNNNSTTISGPLQTILKFVLDSLSGTLTPSRVLTLQVLGCFIFFLRQLYRTCDGIHLLQGYALPTAVTRNMGDLKWFRAWNEAGGVEMARKEWETMNVDNLLNFAGTTRGVLVLHESGAMEQCVAHMFNRYQKKLQVSACEKFGYGVLVSQVSVTGPGMKALCRTGLIGSYIRTLWDLLEFDNPFGEPEIEIDDYHSRKMVSSMLKALSSFSGLCAILEIEQEREKSGGAGAVVDVNTFSHVMRKLVLVDSPIPDDALVTYDECNQVFIDILL
ncbi:hypothetical protein HDU98_011976, partial [Podochytrium sp. JEL0797]